VTIVGRYGATVAARAREVYWRWKKRSTARDRLRYLRFLANPRIRCIAWHPDTVYRAMCEADIGIIPIQQIADALATEPPSWKVRSENRLTMKMSVGLPVVATPIPSYETVITHGDNGFFARSPKDWMECLEQLRDPELRFRMGNLARQCVSRRFSKEQQAQDLVQVFESLRRTPD